MMKNAGRLFDPLKRRVQMMLARGIVKIINDGAKIQAIQATFLNNETRANVEHFQNYGFSSNPLPGAECIAAFIGGNRDHGIILLVDDRRHRIKNLAPGEAALYNNTGAFVKMMADGSILISSDVKVRVETPVLECTGDIIDNVDTNANTVAEMRTIYNNHTHGENDSGGPTDTPGTSM